MRTSKPIKVEVTNIQKPTRSKRPIHLQWSFLGNKSKQGEQTDRLINSDDDLILGIICKKNSENKQDCSVIMYKYGNAISETKNSEKSTDKTCKMVVKMNWPLKNISEDTIDQTSLRIQTVK